MKKLTALAVALLASTAAYAEPYQTNERFRTNWNTLEEKAHLKPSGALSPAAHYRRPIANECVVVSSARPKRHSRDV